MSFTLDMQAFADKTNAVANAVVRKVVLDVGKVLVLKSPVGDAKYWKSPPPKGYVGGRFRANWQYGLNNPNTMTSEAIDPTGNIAISAIVGKVNPEAAGKKHYITNSLPYAQRLEDGWSRQAPNGMVTLTILEFLPIVEAAAAEFKI